VVFICYAFFLFYLLEKEKHSKTYKNHKCKKLWLGICDAFLPMDITMGDIQKLKNK
jgi:hypothetical protein